jgi:hypothetical protein
MKFTTRTRSYGDQCEINRTRLIGRRGEVRADGRVVAGDIARGRRGVERQELLLRVAAREGRRRVAVAVTVAAVAVAALREREGRSIQANVGVEFKGVSWR